MTAAGRGTLVLGILAATVLLLLGGPPRAEPLGAPLPARSCEVPVELPGEGVLCLEAEEARRRGVRAGDVLSGDGRTRMAPERIELLGAAVDLNAAAVEEVAALPGVGPRLAERIVAARPFRAIDELRSVPGVGAKRFAAIAPRVILGGGPPVED